MLWPLELWSGNAPDGLSRHRDRAASVRVRRPNYDRSSVAARLRTGDVQPAASALLRYDRDIPLFASPTRVYAPAACCCTGYSASLRFVGVGHLSSDLTPWPRGSRHPVYRLWRRGMLCAACADVVVTLGEQMQACCAEMPESPGCPLPLVQTGRYILIRPLLEKRIRCASARLEDKLVVLYSGIWARHMPSKPLYRCEELRCAARTPDPVVDHRRWRQRSCVEAAIKAGECESAVAAQATVFIVASR